MSTTNQGASVASAAQRPAVAGSTATQANPRSRKILAPLVLLLSLMLVAGCSGGNDSGGTVAGVVGSDGGRSAADSAGDEAAPGGVPETAPSDSDLPGGSGGGVSGGGAPDAVPPLRGLPEQIVRTGDVSVDVDSVTSAANRVTSLVSSAGGSVASDQRYGGARDGTADLVLRVPPDSFEGLLDSISELGDELSRSVSADDVSTVVADVDARVRSLQNSVDRLLALAAQAVSVSDLITIESELSSRQGELESLQAQQRALADQVSLATLSVRFSAARQPEAEDGGFLASLGKGWAAFLAAGSGLISIIGVLLPWLILATVLGIALRFAIRRRRTIVPATESVTEPRTEPVTEPAVSAPDPPRG